MKVFISSTFEDLKDYREAAVEVVNRYKGAPLAMEFFLSQAQEPTKACEKEIKECDVFVGIYAHRYGFIPGGKKKSITQLEYELAKKLDKDCLCFIVDKDFAWKPRFIEHDKHKELGVFLKEVKKERTCSFFTTAADFEIKLSTSLGKFIAGKSAASGAGKKKAADGACIPVAPTPFIAHPYPLQQNFTGRDAEQAMLSKKEQEVASRLSVFRGVFTFESAKVLFPKMKEDRLWELMVELRGLGFLFYDEKEVRFDFHPILRSFLYDSLVDRAGVHTLAVGYFQPLAEVEKIVSLEDLAPVIELYHHLVKAGKYDEAHVLFRDRISEPTYFQLSAYQLSIELLKELFPHGEDQLPRLEKEPTQAWTLNDLACTYTLSGQPARAVPLYLLANKLYEKHEKKKYLAIGLGNVALNQIIICQLSASTAHLRKRIALCRETEVESQEAVGHQNLGCVLAFQGKIKAVKGDSPCAEEEIAKSTAHWEKIKDYQGLSIDCAYRSLSALVQARLAALVPGEETHGADLGWEAVTRAREALAFAEKYAETRYPHPRDFVQAYWLLGEALIQCLLSPGAVPWNHIDFEIPFYDEYFQEVVEMVKLEKDQEWAAAERCLNEALRRCRKVNLVDHEPDILLAHARLLQAKKSPLADIEKNLEEANDIAQRAGYRLKLADLHLFCGQVLLQSKEKQTLLGLKAHEHLESVKEYALDVSEFSHLYQSQDPDFYKGIPEYQMLKRGMTKEERIKNGYWPAYRMAEILLGT